MARHILQISYTIREGKRNEFLRLATEMKEYFADEQKKSYAIFEVKGGRDRFIEQFTCTTQEEFDALEDDSTEKGEQLVSRLSAMIEGGAAKYTTMIEAI